MDSVLLRTIEEVTPRSFSVVIELDRETTRHSVQVRYPRIGEHTVQVTSAEPALHQRLAEAPELGRVVETLVGRFARGEPLALPLQLRDPEQPSSPSASLSP